jgi:hypothetical protein
MTITHKKKKKKNIDDNLQFPNLIIRKKIKKLIGLNFCMFNLCGFSQSLSSRQVELNQTQHLWKIMQIVTKIYLCF